jgi:hypothetical protein
MLIFVTNNFFAHLLTVPYVVLLTPREFQLKLGKDLSTVAVKHDSFTDIIWALP